MHTPVFISVILQPKIRFTGFSESFALITSFETTGQQQPEPDRLSSDCTAKEEVVVHSLGILMIIMDTGCFGFTGSVTHPHRAWARSTL